MNERQLIPLNVEGMEQSLCETSCDGACCKAGVTIALYPDEAKDMEELYGAKLRQRGGFNILGYGSFEFVEDCPNLTVTEQMGVCAVWEDGWRPAICGDFEVGSKGCDFIRNDGAFPQDR